MLIFLSGLQSITPRLRIWLRIFILVSTLSGFPFATEGSSESNGTGQSTPCIQKAMGSGSGAPPSAPQSADSEFLLLPYVKDFKERWQQPWDSSTQRRYVLLVGVNFSTEDGSFEELTPDDTGESGIEVIKGNEIASAFRTWNYGGFDSDIPTVLEGSNATSFRIRQFVQDASINKNDSLLIYILAHGQNKSNQSPSNPDFKVKLFGGDDIRISGLISDIAENRWGHATIILDSCFSEAAQDISLVPEVEKRIAILTDANEKGKAVFLERGAKASALGYFLRETLIDPSAWTNADIDKDGIITLDELDQQLNRRIDCVKNSGEISSDNGMNIELKGRDSMRFLPLAFSPDRITRVDTRPWIEIKNKYQLEAQTSALQLVEGNTALIKDQNLYVSSAASAGLKSSIEDLSPRYAELVSSSKYEQAALARPLVLSKARIMEYWSRLKDLSNWMGLGRTIAENPKPTFDRALALSASAKYAEAETTMLSIEAHHIESIKKDTRLANFEKAEAFENFYLYLGLVQRFQRKFEAAAKSYDRGLALVKESRKLRISKASTIIFLPNDRLHPDRGNEAVNLVVEAVALDHRYNHRLETPETKKAVEGFVSQLHFLGRYGDLENLLDRTADIH